MGEWTVTDRRSQQARPSAARWNAFSTESRTNYSARRVKSRHDVGRRAALGRTKTLAQGAGTMRSPIEGPTKYSRREKSAALSMMRKLARNAMRLLSTESAQ